ncbi:MAG TPA: nucleotidyltransferase [Terriglobia bacterium]|nr:nucleotidyltransferase [Terriglobia bacterium]
MEKEPINRMTIPLAQLETWSHQGSVAQSKATYATVKAALEDAKATYTDRNFKVFLQGSYGNDTNIYAESDVDVVIRYDGAFFHDIDLRPDNEQAAFHAAYPGNGTYSYAAFKEHVRQALRAKFGDAVDPSTKAIRIEGNGNRRDADVIVAFEFRRYYHFNSGQDDSHELGMCFFLADGTRIANYPDQHSENLTAKHQATDNKFKPMIRIFKNARSKMIDDGLIADGSAPSYYIEGLLYNVPNTQFVGNHQDIFLNILKWLYDTKNRTNFLTANEQYYLLRNGYHTNWPIAEGNNFISAAIKLWNEWQ